MRVALSDSPIHFAILLGAGAHLQPDTRDSLASLIDQASLEAQALLRTLASANGSIRDGNKLLLDITERITSTLEESPFTNCGKGSELTSEGHVECDASVIYRASCSQEVTASVGAVPELLCPVQLCRKLIDEQLQTSPTQPLSVPNFLVGRGALEHGLRHGLRRGSLVTDKALASHNRWKNIIKTTVVPDQKMEESLNRYVDTVGVIVLSGEELCAASSSGGPLLKSTGRLGPAAIVGSGLDINGRTAAVCSGFGEDINTMRLAQAAVTTEEDLDSIVANLSASKFIQRKPAQVGAIRATSVSRSKAIFEWYHSTPSMACGFGTLYPKASTPRIKHVFSKKPQTGGLVFDES